MHGDAGGLVDHQQRLVFVDDGGFQPLQQPLRQRRRLVALGQTQRRHAHHIAGLQLVFGLDAPFVHTHLSLAQDAIDQRLGDAFQLRSQEVVDALAGQFRRDFQHLHAGGRGGSRIHGAA